MSAGAVLALPGNTFVAQCKVERVSVCVCFNHKYAALFIRVFI